jgi:hypothetical protein
MVQNGHGRVYHSFYSAMVQGAKLLNLKQFLGDMAFNDSFMS